MEDCNTFSVVLYFESREYSFEFNENQEKNLSSLLLSLRNPETKMLEVKNQYGDTFIDMSKVLYYTITKVKCE